MDEGGALDVISAPVVSGIFAALGCIGPTFGCRIIGRISVGRSGVEIAVEGGVRGRDVRRAVPCAVASRVACVARDVAHGAVASPVARTGCTARSRGATRAASTAPRIAGCIGLRIGRRTA